MSDDRASYYERIRGQLLALVIELDDRLTPDQQNWAHEYLDANELGLALEMIAETGRLTSMEMVEVNPTLDDCNKTAELAVELIASALGSRIL